VCYAMITYATAFLKAHYPWEWWTAVLSNSSSKEINEKYWKYVSSIMAPPDINLSGTEMIIDYNTKKIRSKLTLVDGLADAGVKAIISGRPYSSIEDVVTKETISPSMARKLIAVGVMDSLFPEGTSFLTKMQAYEDALENLKYEEKLKTFEPGPRKKAPTKKVGKIDSAYLGLGPLEMFALKKKILPSMPFSLTGLILDLNLVDKNNGLGLVQHPRFDNKKVVILNGEQATAVEGRVFENNTTLACVGYVVDAKEFTFKKDATKKGLKILLDTDNYLRELVMWPDYDSGKLVYPEGMGKGAIGVFFLNKRANKPDTSVSSLKVFKNSK